MNIITTDRATAITAFLCGYAQATRYGLPENVSYTLARERAAPDFVRIGENIAIALESGLDAAYACEDFVFSSADVCTALGNMTVAAVVASFISTL